MEARSEIDEAIAAIRPPDEQARDAARALQLRLSKPVRGPVALVHEY